MERKTGYYQKLGEYNYFIPNKLPPQDPEFNFNGELIELYGEAMQAIGQLNEMAKRLPNIERFIKAYCLKEAMLSSAIENIHTTLIEIFTKETSSNNKNNKSTQLVLNYNEALNQSLKMTADLPIVSRIILNAHKILMSGGEGDRANPGKYRDVVVSVGEFIPPPANMVNDLMADLEGFINDNSSLPPLIKAGLTHIQFETIHPFADGNGRIGRLLIVLMLIYDKILYAPILYPSVYFKKHHLKYYQKLNAVRTKGDFEGWIKFYLEAIKDGSLDSYKRAKAIESLERRLRDNIANDKEFSGIRETSNTTLSILFQSPVITVRELEIAIEKSYNTANNIIDKFMHCGILKQSENIKRNKIFRFEEYLNVLEEE